MPERPDDFEVARLILAPERRLGTSFDDAWQMVLGALPPLGAAGRPRAARRGPEGLDERERQRRERQINADAEPAIVDLSDPEHDE